MERAMKTFKISRTVIDALIVIVLTVSIPVVAYGQKKVSSATTINTQQMMADAKDLPTLQVAEPF